MRRFALRVRVQARDSALRQRRLGGVIVGGTTGVNPLPSMLLAAGLQGASVIATTRRSDAIESSKSPCSASPAW